MPVKYYKVKIFSLQSMPNETECAFLPLWLNMYSITQTLMITSAEL